MSDACKIMMNKGKEFALVDKEDFDVLGHYPWHVLNTQKGKKYALRFIKGTRKRVYLHREIINPLKAYKLIILMGMD
jgi:hypothetical protein